MLEAPTLSGPPVTEDGVTTISGSVPIVIRGTVEGSAIVSFTLALGVDGAPNTGAGGFVFEGSIAGRVGTLEATLDNWVAGGDAAFTSAHFEMVPGSGTGDLSNLVEYQGMVQREETREVPVGIAFGTYRFTGDSSPSEVKAEEEPKDLSKYSIAELFAMEAAGEISEDELAAELERRN